MNNRLSSVFEVAKSANDTITNRNANHQPKQPMSDKSIEERVKDIIVDQLGVSADQVTPEAKFVEVPDEEAEKLQAVGDVVTYINSQQG